MVLPKLRATYFVPTHAPDSHTNIRILISTGYKIAPFQFYYYSVNDFDMQTGQLQMAECWASQRR